MADRALLAKLKPYAVFLLAYTGGFWLFTATLRYTFPFLTGFLLALVLQPVMRLLRERLRFAPGCAATLATAALYVLLVGALSLLGIWLVGEISTLIRAIRTADLGLLTEPLDRLLVQAGEWASRIDQDFLRENQKQLLNLAQTAASVLLRALTAALGFLTSLPAVLMMFLVMVTATYCFSKNMERIRAQLSGMLSTRGKGMLRAASRHGMHMAGRYLASCLMLYGLTFLETLLVFFAMDAPYPLMLSLVAGFADILPILGPGAVYLPLALLYFAQGAPLRGIFLVVCWLLIGAVRQVVEPKLLSASTQIHPLAMLAALYFALAANSFLLLVYLVCLLLLAQALRQAEILPAFFAGRNPL